MAPKRPLGFSVAEVCQSSSYDIRSPGWGFVPPGRAAGRADKFGLESPRGWDPKNAPTRGVCSVLSGSQTVSTESGLAHEYQRPQQFEPHGQHVPLGNEAPINSGGFDTGHLEALPAFWVCLMLEI